MLKDEIKESRGRGWQNNRSLVLVILAALALVTGCATSPLQNARYWKICTGVPNAQVRFTRSDGSLAVIPRAACEAVARAEGRIEGVSGFRPDRILIADTEEVNAYTGNDTNGRPLVIVTLGMLKEVGTDEAAWAALFGHEIAHQVLNHQAGRKDAEERAQAVGQGLGNVIVQLIPGVGGFVAGTAANFVAANALYGAYTRPQEHEADEQGLHWMVAAGYDPRGMARLFDMRAKQSTGGLPGFLSTHPGAEDRAKMVQDFIATTARKIEPTTISEAKPFSPIGSWKGLSKSKVTGAAANADIQIGSNGSFAYRSAYGAELVGTLRQTGNTVSGIGNMKMPEAYRGQRLSPFPDGTREAFISFNGQFSSETKIQGTFSGGGDSGTFEFTRQ